MNQRPPDAWFRPVLFALFCVGLFLRVAAVLVLDDYRSPISAEYGIVARNLVAGQGFSGGGWLGPEAPSALNAPGYSLFLAAWLRVGGALPYLGVELSQALLSAAVIVLIAAIALHLSGWLTSLLAAGLATVYPPLIYFCKQISPAIFTVFFACAALLALLWLLSRPGWWRAILAGLIFGLALHVEPVLLVALPGVALVELGMRPQVRRRVPWRSLLLAAVVCGVLALPWTVRNYAVFRRWVPLKTSFGLNFWMGNNPNATGFQYTLDGQPMQDTLSADQRSYLASLDEAERYSALAQRAWQWIQDHPARFLELTARRIGYLWWISPTHQLTTDNIEEPQVFYRARAWLQAPVLALGLIGAARALVRNRRLLAHGAWWIVAFTVPYALSVAGNTRYRLPAEPMLLVLVAFGLAGAMGRLAASRSAGQPLEVRG